jgi:cytochrome c oxidase assembly factor CtaG
VVRRALATLGAALAPSLALAHEGDAHGAVDLWRAYGFDLYVVLPMLLAAGIYGAGVARLWRRAGRSRGVETWRAGCFAGAMLALGLALIWPFDVLGGMILSAHMVQHLLLTTAAAPLLALSAPLAAGLWALPRAARRAAGGVAHAAGMRRGWTLLTLPLFAWAFYAASLWLWHMPRFYEAAARDELVHILEHLCFLASALVLWWTALLSARTSALGVGAGIFLLFTTALQDGLLGALLAFAPRPLYGLYAENAHLLGLDPVADQQLGGIIMWIFGGLIYLTAALVLAWRFLLAPARAPLRQGARVLPVEVSRPKAISLGL